MKPRIPGGISLGVCQASSYTPDHPAIMRACGELGIAIVRMGCAWDQVNPKPGIWDWSRPDAEYKAIRDAGMSVYLNPGAAPAWATEDKPAYVSTAQLMDDSPGCVVWSHDERIIKFADERDYCVNAPHISADAMQHFATSLAIRYSAEFYGIWNEPGYALFYPPSFHPGTWYQRFVDEIAAPFAAGVLAVRQAAVLVGPEAEDWGTLGALLEIEKRSATRLWDIISFHPYAWAGPFPDDALRRLNDEFMKVADQYRGNRAVWVSEINGGGFAEKLAFMRALSARPAASPISALIWLQPEDLFASVTDGKYALSEFGAGIAEMFRAAGHRRYRAVTS